MKKFIVTTEEYNKLKELVQIINDTTLSTVQRKIAKAQYETMMKIIINTHGYRTI